MHCSSRYHRNIVSMADLMVLAKAKMCILEFNSNWGRLVRALRVQMKNGTAAGDDVDRTTKGVASPFVLDTRVAWGDENAMYRGGFPGM